MRLNKVRHLRANDNVVVALRDLNAGETIDIGSLNITVVDFIPQGHKVAIKWIEQDENIIKYGYPIGHATQTISEGSWVHTHNLATNLSGMDSYHYKPKLTHHCYQEDDRHFYGFQRKNGEVGIRNALWIVPTVGCVNGVAEKILEQFKQEIDDLTPFDGAQVLMHQYGCSQLGDDHENTRQILTNLVHHPNAGGVLVLGLGCENNTVEAFIDGLGDYDHERVQFLVTQSVSNEIAEGVRKLKLIHEAAQMDKREKITLSKLKIGLKCGGSDGLSGLTANPLVGMFSDFLIAQGGTTVLTEVPEMFGAEKILMERAESQEIFDQIVDMINDFKTYFIKNDQPIYENPSPGNKQGGISTLEDKSLGCTQKAGISNVKGVLKYGERLTKNGLHLLSSPGNDLVAASALASSGCHMILFTTGRGTPFGTVVPTIKLSSNRLIYQKKPHWIDFNAGDFYGGERLLNDFIDYVLGIASGNEAKNETNGYRELAIFKTGVTL